MNQQIWQKEIIVFNADDRVILIQTKSKTIKNKK